MEDSEAYAVAKKEVVTVVNALEAPIAEHLDPKLDETGNEASPQLPLPPPPGPPVSRISSAAQTHGSGLVNSTTNIDNQNHDQNEAIENTNVHILNSLHTRKVDDNTGMCKLFYELEKEIHENNESKIHFCLHKKMDPKVVQNILDSFCSIMHLY